VTVEQRTATIVVPHDLQHLPLADRTAAMTDGRLSLAPTRPEFSAAH
jgi:hypothetical protein